MVARVVSAIADATRAKAAPSSRIGMRPVCPGDASVGAVTFVRHGVGMTTHRIIEPSVLYFGTPVAVVSSQNCDGSTNLAPISSYWALDDLLVLGLGANGHTLQNLRRMPELVLNLVEETQWREIETLGALTGAHPVPAGKPASCRYVPDKFDAVGWTPLPSTTVDVERVAQAAVHLEGTVIDIDDRMDGIAIVRALCTVVHAEERITVPGTSHVNPLRWKPLIYSFRHYFGLGARRGIAGRAEVKS